jgi:UDP-GlcNAc:undecaprenyl-phosphate GlcNAc-1-phosphate transferase
MIRMLVPAFAAFAVTVATVPVVQCLCERTQLFDRPGPLKIHSHPIPRLGGVAILFGILAGLFASGQLDLWAHSSVFAGLAIVWLAGLLDDLRGLHPAARLAAQIAAATVLWLGGARLPLAPGGPASWIAVCLLVILYVNAFNFLDGSDGLATGVACVIALTFAALPQGALSRADLAIAISMAAACAGFLPANFPPATMFPGDSASTILGFLTVYLGLHIATTRTTPHAALLPFVIAALPLFDAVRVVGIRILNNRPPTAGDRNHFYDRLSANGWSKRRVALTSWAISAACGALAVLVARAYLPAGWIFVVFAAIALWMAAVSLAPDGKTTKVYEETNVSATQ